MHDAFALDLDVAAFLEHEAIAESLVNRLRHGAVMNGVADGKCRSGATRMA
jgi:hypothetical protein